MPLDKNINLRNLNNIKDTKAKTLEEIFEEQTGEKALIWTTDGVHVVQIEIYNPVFVGWLKNLVIESTIIRQGE